MDTSPAITDQAELVHIHTYIVHPVQDPPGVLLLMRVTATSSVSISPSPLPLVIPAVTARGAVAKLQAGTWGRTIATARLRS